MLIDWRAVTKAAAGEDWSDLDEPERRQLIRDVQAEWLRRRYGQDDERPTYGAWLKAQPASVQDEILGVTRARLFRSGGLTIDRFTDPVGRPLTLEELAKTRPEAFTRAGLDPDDFT